MEKPKRKGRPPGFTMTICMGDKTYTAKGKTIVECLEKIEKPVKITTKATLTIKRGDRKLVRGMQIVPMRRMLFPAFYEQNAKTLSLAFK